MSYLDAAEAMEQKAKETETMALCSAGAFPGFSNVLAMECAQRLRDAGSTELEDLNFSYFTAGLGGSGPVNLLITNLGFGDPVPVWRQGRYAPRMAAGSEMREVDFFLDLRSSQRLRSDGADAHRDAGTLGGLAAVVLGFDRGIPPDAFCSVPRHGVEAPCSVRLRGDLLLIRRHETARREADGEAILAEGSAEVLELNLSGAAVRCHGSLVILSRNQASWVTMTLDTDAKASLWAEKLALACGHSESIAKLLSMQRHRILTLEQHSQETSLNSEEVERCLNFLSREYVAMRYQVRRAESEEKLPEDEAVREGGTREVWSWPFPEAGTVPRRLKIRGNSSTGMGTAPGIWNTILVALVSLVPRSLWRNRSFSEGLAYFSLPMVWVTDQFVKETHAMRVEVTSRDGRSCVGVQAHRSFRRCVAQSAAEFMLHLLERRLKSKEATRVGGRPGGLWLSPVRSEMGRDRSPNSYLIRNPP
eukprot:g30677.t1